MGGGGSEHEEADGREEFGLRYWHFGGYGAEEGGCEVVAVRVGGVDVWFSATVEMSALGYGGGDEGLELGEARGGDEGADVGCYVIVRVGVVGGICGGERGPEAEISDAGFEEGDEEVVGVGAGDYAFYADTILACGGENAFHEDG